MLSIVNRTRGLPSYSGTLIFNGPFSKFCLSIDSIPHPRVKECASEAVGMATSSITKRSDDIL